MISRLEFRTKLYHHDLNNHNFVYFVMRIKPQTIFRFLSTNQLTLTEASKSSQLTFGVKKRRKMHNIIDQGKSSPVFFYE